MAQRVRISHRGRSPSSVTQLPILTALHAGSPTLFPNTINDSAEKVKYFLLFCGTKFSEICICIHSKREESAACAFLT